MEDSQLLACWPVILNKSFEESEIRRLLAENHKVKVTDSTGQGVIIFPLSSVAFMIVPLAQVFNEIEGQLTLNSDIMQRIEGLNQIHRHAYIVVVAAQIESEEVQAMTALQNRFLGTKARFILAQSPKECVDYMIMIAKVTWKPMANVIQERMKTLRQTTVSDNVVLQVLSTMGLNNHECLVLQHGCKTLSAVSQATEEDLLNCSLDQQTAHKVKSFFEKDCIQI